jgi:hypothetical protein
MRNRSNSRPRGSWWLLVKIIWRLPGFINDAKFACPSWLMRRLRLPSAVITHSSNLLGAHQPLTQQVLELLDFLFRFRVVGAVDDVASIPRVERSAVVADFGSQASNALGAQFNSARSMLPPARSGKQHAVAARVERTFRVIGVVVGQRDTLRAVGVRHVQTIREQPPHTPASGRAGGGGSALYQSVELYKIFLPSGDQKPQVQRPLACGHQTHICTVDVHREHLVCSEGRARALEDELFAVEGK